jgi:hypothetical protein
MESRYRTAPGHQLEGARLDANALPVGAEFSLDTEESYKLIFRNIHTQIGTKVLRLVESIPPLPGVDLEATEVVADQVIKKRQPFGLTSTEADLSQFAFRATRIVSDLERVDE